MKNGEFKMQRGIKIAPIIGRGRKRIYPFDEMKIGDSFFVRGKTASQLSSSSVEAKKRTGFNFTCRTVESGVRVWRVK